MAIDYNDTVTLMAAMERVKPPAALLVDTFFPNIPTPAVTNQIMVEYKKGGRRLAPFVTKSGKGINMKREQSKIDIYVPPMVGPRRIINANDISRRGFGEGIYSATTPAERATKLQADDLKFLQDSIMNRKNVMAAKILTDAKYEIKGYADDGKLQLVDTVEFPEFDQKIVPTKTWDNADAHIFDDLNDASSLVQENAGMIPTVAIGGKNIAKYLLNNEQIMKWLSIPNANNLSLMGLQPQLTSPQVMRVGYINALNMEIYSYMETYTDDDGTVKPFLGDDDLIVAIPGKGYQLHGAVTLVQDKSYVTYSGLYVPKYTADETENEIAVSMFSRFVLTPESLDDWVVIKMKG